MRVDDQVKTVFRYLALSALVVTICGCAETLPASKRYLWPRPPDRPRIEWLGAYASQLDLPTTAGRKFKNVIVGEDAPIPFVAPMDIKSDGKGRVFVADPGVPAIFVYDMSRKEVRLFPRKHEEMRFFRQPISIALDQDGGLFVADRWLGLVVVYSSDEKYRGIINLKGRVGKLAAIAIDKARKRLLVADTGDHKIKVFTLSGEFQFEFGGHGEEDGKFNYPIAIAINRAGEIHVADALNARIQIFDGAGRFLRKFGQRGSGIGDIQLIKGVATDSDGNIYVTDGLAHRVLVYSSTGEFLLPVGGMYSIATRKLAPGGFVVPQGIDIDQNDMIYVVDQMNRRFQVFQYLSDEYIRHHPLTDAAKP